MLAAAVERLVVELGRTEPWQRDALCAEPAYRHPGWFFPERGAPVDDARAVCERCLVRVECLDFALRTKIKHGIWGGLSERERRRLRRDQSYAA